MNMPADPLDDGIARDLEALRASTARDVPPFLRTAREIRGALLSRPHRARAARRAAWGWIAAASALPIALGFAPFSYPTLAGHDVALAVRGPLPPPSVEEVARGFRAGIAGEGMRVEHDGGWTTFRTRVRDRSSRGAQRAAEVFAGVLRGRGVETEVSVSPWTAPARGTVYAFASDRVERLLVGVRGRTAAEIETEIAARLAAIGFRETRVSVEHGDGLTGVSIRATGPDGRELETEVRRELAGARAEDAPPIEIDLTEFSDLDDLPVEQRREAIERRLRERGIDATVTIEDGELRIEVHDGRIRR
jgi:hypothetical protein